MSIENELVKTMQRKKAPIEGETNIPDSPVVNTEEESEVHFTGKFDLSDEELYNPAREKYKKTKTGKKGYSFVSVYMRPEEQDHLEKLAKKHRMSKAAVLRMLIINAK